MSNPKWETIGHGPSLVGCEDGHWFTRCEPCGRLMASGSLEGAVSMGQHHDAMKHPFVPLSQRIDSLSDDQLRAECERRGFTPRTTTFERICMERDEWKARAEGNGSIARSVLEIQLAEQRERAEKAEARAEKAEAKLSRIGQEPPPALPASAVANYVDEWTRRAKEEAHRVSEPKYGTFGWGARGIGPRMLPDPHAKPRHEPLAFLDEDLLCADE